MRCHEIQTQLTVKKMLLLQLFFFNIKYTIEAEDAQSLLNHFKCKQGKDPNFFYPLQLDQYGRIANFFWRDGGSKLDACLGDVVCFDTTCRANKYNMICAPLVGVNQHWKNVLFGCTFLLGDSTESFRHFWSQWAKNNQNPCLKLKMLCILNSFNLLKKYDRKNALHSRFVYDLSMQATCL